MAASPEEVERGELGFSLETVRGKSLRVVERVCSSSGVCVFFVHGGGGRAGQFKHQIKHLEKEYNVVAFDFLGHGGSPAPRQPRLYTVQEHLEDLKAVYEAHKKEHNVFVSHCYGAIHTLHLVRWLKEQGRGAEVKGVAVLSLGATAPVSLGLAAKIPAFILEWLRPLARASSNRAIFTPNSDPALIHSENTLSETNRMYMMKVIGVDCSDNEMWTSTLHEGREALEDKSCICVYGEEDGVFPVASCQEAARALGIAEERCHPLKRVGHLCMLESHEQVSQIIQNLISELF